MPFIKVQTRIHAFHCVPLQSFRLLKGVQQMNEHQNMNDMNEVIDGFNEESIKAPTVIEVIAEVKDGEANEKKQVSWSKLGDMAIASFPCGKLIYFDLKVLDTQVMKYYGSKQWLSDSVSAVKDEKEKIQALQDNYNEASKMGLELTATGKVSVIGKVRANSTGNAEAKALASAIREASKVVSLEGLVMKKAMANIPGQPEFTTEDAEKLKELMQAAVEASK